MTFARHMNLGVKFQLRWAFTVENNCKKIKYKIFI